ncbi:MAG: hypothetical protein K6C10_10805 [Prevotella sp.]|nr:hypothetical protein [Prevotella sp.]
METQKIPLYKFRRFGEKISDTFAFVGDNFKTLLKFVTCAILPFALIGGLAGNGYINGLASIIQGSSAGDPSTESLIGTGVSYAGLLLVILLGYVALFAAVYGLMRVYADRENGLRGLTWKEFKPMFTHLVKRGLKLMLFIFVITILACVLLGGLIGLLGDENLMVLFFLIFYVLLLIIIMPLMLMTPIYLFEDDIKLFPALKKSFHLGFPTWGGIFAVLIVLELIVGVVSGLLSLPWLIALFAKIAFGIEEGATGFVGTFGFSLMFFVLTAYMLLVSFVCYGLVAVGMAYQYGHAAEKVDHVSGQPEEEKMELPVYGEENF